MIPFESEYLYEEYVVKGRSTYDIAEEWSTYASKIRRALIKFGLRLRDKSVAAVTAYETGRKDNTGHKQTEETREKIGKAVVATWEKKKESGDPIVVFHRDTAKKAVKVHGKAHFDEMRELGASQTRLTAERGTLIVKYIMEKLNASPLKFVRTDPPINLISEDGKVVVAVDGFYRNNKKNADTKFAERNRALIENRAFEKLIIVTYKDRFFKAGSAQILLDKIRTSLYNSPDRVIYIEHPGAENGGEAQSRTSE